MTNLIVYLFVGAVGGFIGAKTRLPAGILLGSVLAVIAMKMIAGQDPGIPRAYAPVCQVLLGVLIASTYQPGMFRQLGPLAVPMVVSTLVLVIAGFVLSLLFERWGVMDFASGYIATSPGAMNALVPLAIDVNANAALVALFHFFRIIFVAITAPVIFRLLNH